MTPADTTGHDAWPELPYQQWAPTKKTMQMVAQMLGKAKIALAPPLPEWLHTCLFLDGRGFTTGALPWDRRLVEMGIDVYDVVLWITVSDGREAQVELGPNRCVADIWADFLGALQTLGITLDMWDKPQELADATPFSQNHHDCTFDSGQAQRFYTILASLQGIFEEYRSPFFGRSGIQFWWGGFDFDVLLFSGKHTAAPHDRGYIMRYDLDAAQINCGFWPGDDTNPKAMIYGYIHPRPDGCATAPIRPTQAAWADAMGEWVMDYEAIRHSPDPGAEILTFMRSVYGVATTQGGWDAADLTYVLPAPSKRGAR